MGASAGICSCSKPEYTLKGKSATPTYSSSEPAEPANGRKKKPGKEWLLAAAASSFALAALSAEDLEHVLEAFQGPLAVDQGKELFKQGDPVQEGSPGLYVLEKGSLEGIGGSGDVRWKKFSYDTPGRVFGELATMYNEPRGETVVATSPSVVWFLDRLTFDLVVKKKAMEAYAENDRFLASIDIFGRITAAERKKIANNLRLRTCSAGDTIIRMGDVGHELLFLQAGRVHASIKGERVAEYEAPSYFGARALVFGEPRAANVIADISPTKLAVLDEDIFATLPADMRGDMTQLPVRK